MMPEFFTTHSFDESKKQRLADYQHVRNDNHNRGRDGINIGGNHIKTYQCYKSLWEFEKPKLAL